MTMIKNNFTAASLTAGENGVKGFDLRDFLSSRDLTLEAITSAIAPARDEIAYVTGSVTDGFGDLSSDLDVFVLTTNESFENRTSTFVSERRRQQELLQFGIVYLNVKNTEFDVEFHRRSKIESLFNALAELQPGNRADLWANYRSLGGLERTIALELLHRFRVSVPLTNHLAYETLRANFDERKFLLWNAHFHLIECEDFTKGTRRSLKENDPENAYLKLMRLFDALGDTLLFLSGKSLDRWKWRLPKLRRLPENGFLHDYITVMLAKGASQNLSHFVEKNLERAGFWYEKLSTGIAQS